MTVDYDNWLCAEHERQEEAAARTDGLVEAFEKSMDAGSRDYLEYTTVEEMADLLDAIRTKLGMTGVTLSLRQAHVQSLIAHFQNDIGARYVRETADAAEAVDWYDDTI